MIMQALPLQTPVNGKMNVDVGMVGKKKHEKGRDEIRNMSAKYEKLLNRERGKKILSV